MIVFLAGNFPMMQVPEKEREMKKALLERGYDYNRLVSAWYAKGAESVIKICRERQAEDTMDGIVS